MNDPWDVKSVRLGNQYTSCMKINGVPLLPPVLSVECRKEMQYYKLLAKEVEKRISILKPYMESETESNCDATDAPEITESEDHEFVTPLEEKVETIIDFTVDNYPQNEQETTPKSLSPMRKKYKTNMSEVQDSQIAIDLNVNMGEGRGIYSCVHRSPRNSPEPDEIPERDCDYKKKQKEVITDLITNKKTEEEFMIDIINHNLGELSIRDLISTHQDGPSSLSSKSFTGSLNDIHADVSKQSQGPKLIRQRSYTVLNPSPQLLAHLEVQSFNTGVELNSISMSESMSKLSQTATKRKSWDLESAKVKWSSMAMELKTKNIVTKPNGTSNISINAAKNLTRKQSHSPMAKSNSLSQDRRARDVPSRTSRSENGQRPKTTYGHKGRSLFKDNQPINKTSAIDTTPKPASPKNTPKPASPKKEESPNKTVALVSESDDPAARVRELYEKLQKQQEMQMANLMEKQKREQQLLQQVFEEQNSILYKQLKTVCPKASIEVKQAWGDIKDDNDRGPVSLSQLINTITPENSMPPSPVSTLTETNSCISKCDSMLQKSREITSSLRKPTPKPRTTNGVRQKPIDQSPTRNSLNFVKHTPRSTSRTLNYDTSSDVRQKPIDQSPTRNSQNSVKHTPRSTSRRLNYDTSSDVDPMLTDRTNDTMADLNITFPSDNSESNSCSQNNSSRKTYATRACSPLSPRDNELRGTLSARKRTEGAIKNLENNIQSSIDSMSISSRSVKKQSIIYRQPSPKELVAATKIVACAKGFLVRRLMRTERVQTTVQTIRDALLCALQLHQDREGIRGADVDLHRRLIQQITAACYTLHDTFVTSTANERCSLIAADRARRQALATKQPTPRLARRDTREKLAIDCESFLTCQTSSSQINYVSEAETSFSGDRSRRYFNNPRKVPWR